MAVKRIPLVFLSVLSVGDYGGTNSVGVILAFSPSTFSSPIRQTQTQFGPNTRQLARGIDLLRPPTILDAISFGTRSKKGGISKEQSDRFDRTADTDAKIDTPCILTLRGVQYNMTAWARAHPGGPNILKRFHGKDATQAFDASGHSAVAYAMLKDFVICPAEAEPVEAVSTSIKTKQQEHLPTSVESNMEVTSESTSSVEMPTKTRKVPRWRTKLFTHEDPYGLHKTMGVFSLLHFVYRFGQMLFGDPSAGLGTRLGRGPAIASALTILPHGVLSGSSLIFHTVPRERVVGKPMIWQEFRAHNIIFGLRSVFTTLLAWVAIYHRNTPAWRRPAVVLSALSVLIANALADYATHKLRSNNLESTTATMPYWEGCSVQTQRRFKTFYAYCQFLATLACMMCSNPAWPLSVLLPIQLASLLLTLVRKGLISARTYHIGYTASLCMPFVAGARQLLYMKSWDFPVVLGLGWIMLQARRKGANKYALWTPVVAARIAFGDQFINWQIW